MKCLKCGNELKDDEIMCSNCGYNRYTAEQKDNKFATTNIGVYNQNPVDKEEVERKLENQKEYEELVEIYIGSKYYNFRKGGFSWCAFLLGPIYFLYRKLYAVGGLIYLLIMGITTFATIVTKGKYNHIQNLKSIFTIKSLMIYTITYAIIFLALRLFMGFTFKKFYFNEIVERIGMFKKQNPDLGLNQQAEIIKNKGGVNKFIPIIILAIYALIIILSTTAITEFTNISIF